MQKNENNSQKSIRSMVQISNNSLIRVVFVLKCHFQFLQRKLGRYVIAAFLFWRPSSCCLRVRRDVRPYVRLLWMCTNITQCKYDVISRFNLFKTLLTMIMSRFYGVFRINKIPTPDDGNKTETMPCFKKGRPTSLQHLIPHTPPALFKQL